MRAIFETKTENAISAQYIQYTKILQMPAYELRGMIHEEMNENPFLEISEAGWGGGKEPLWMEAAPNPGRREADSDWDAYYGSVGLYGREETLADYLISQLKINDAQLRNIVVYMIHLLDDDGWLREPLEDLAKELQISYELADKALKTIQGLDPCGVGARSLAECLCLQLKQTDQSVESLCMRIIQEHLPELGKKKYAAIAKKLGVHKKDIEAAAAEIYRLNPKPGHEFAEKPETRYAVPEVAVYSDEEGMKISLVRGILPEIRLNQEYISLLRQTKDQESKAYIQEYLPRAKKWNDFVSRRNSTLLKVVRDIVSWQHEFFEREDGEVVPMTLADIAAMEDMHEATISRTVNEKYIITERGIYALEDFFSRAVSMLQDGEQLSAKQIQEKIKKIQKEYQGDKHLSDQKIADILKSQGIHIARRTVAKYRKQYT